MKKPVKILHLASFTGNIGDNASHMGFNSILSNFFLDGFEVTRLEIRKFYNNYTLSDKGRFNDTFVELANAHDLLVIGGGAFLSFWVENSVTGTTLNIDEAVWKKITAPVLITSVGCISNMDIPEGNEAKFKKFIDYLLNREQTVLALRNDGSRDLLSSVLKPADLENIPQILDSGFFYNTEKNPYEALPKKYIVINVTAEQIRMGGGKIHINEGAYHQELKKVIEYITNDTDLDIVFVPHLYNDVSASLKLLEGLNDFSIRERIQFAPHVQKDAGANLLFSIYKKSVLVLGTRFHSNVCSVAMDVPSIGLVAQKRVQDMYDSLQLNDRYIVLDHAFGDELIKKINDTLQNGNHIVEKSGRVCREEKEKTLRSYGEFFAQLKLIS